MESNHWKENKSSLLNLWIKGTSSLVKLIIKQKGWFLGDECTKFNGCH